MHTYDKEQLKKDLQSMGLKPTDALMVHSSMKSIGAVEGGADVVVDAFMEYLSEGLLMMPTHTWKQMSEEYNVFDPETEPGCVGIIPNIFKDREGVVRSLHPTHSIVAYGKDAADYIKGEEELTTPCAPGGCWDRLRAVNAKILLVGVTHARNTFIHAIEEVFDVPERFAERPVDFKVKMPDGTLKDVSMYRHYNVHTAHISESFDKMLEGYEATGAAKKVRLGDAECILCDAVRMFEVTARILEHHKNCFIECESIPADWYME
ncbi:MAG: AAC(3) family N-acetyltransferase [Lachnospiraceae bacterium]|nr:AAC(3) family N-acetyltransferase [Lachnospiraceae bacterium]